ncbi:serine/threonine-protein kinase [Actinomadura rupiterrae]|uniref:serine/threonine-protein kinase n=1 Tax=Actinomadura rupiterrae TaxID=559627 RepID=UPI0020A2FEC4|nr:serine/threonine-protein kinase [Actinomadura rupiterrae]MCP2342028.1 serine/threonine protein kinase [Actinomadura rupiterrae]
MDRIGERYDLIGEIGSGGMGAVFRGYDVVLDRPVALKLIQPTMIVSQKWAEEMAARFRREARITAKIRHHGVPQVYDAVLDNAPAGQLYLVMELIEGVSLRAFIDPDEPLPISWVAAVIAQIATVLSHAHAVPVVHRDLKPDNVLVGPDGTIKVLDFGIAAILGTDVTKLTATGNLLGTRKYMSPEQIRSAKVAPQSDLYALGCMVYELLTGYPPFNTEYEYELYRQHLEEPPVPLRQLRGDVPEDLADLVLELLAKNPEKRPTDAYAVYERLLPFLPMPGTRQLAVHGHLAEMPDPTRIYRQPNAPLPRDAHEEPTIPPLTRRDQVPAPGTRLRSEIAMAREQALALVDADRNAQAADILRGVIEQAAPVLGPDNSEVLALRLLRGSALLMGGDARAALPVLQSVARAYARVKGPTSSMAIAARNFVASCHAHLGQATVALQEYRSLLNDVRALEGDVSETALDIRRTIGELLHLEGDVQGAAGCLEPLYEDLYTVKGPNHEETREVADLLQRLRLATD